MKNLNSLIVVAILIFAALGCSSADAMKKAGPAADLFHQQFNAKQYTEIYEKADDEFKKVVTQEKLNELLDAVHRKLGNFQQAKQTGWYFNTTPLGTVVTLTYDVDFSDGKGTEQFIYKVNGDAVKLLNYNINSPDFITK